MSEEPSPASSRRHSTLVALGIFLSRISGLVRERAIAQFLGTSFATDAFRAALRIPNMLQNLLGEGVLSASFIPVYARLLSEGREEEAGKVAGAIAGLLTALTGVLVLVGVFLAEPLTRLIAAGYTGERVDLTVTLVRILTPGVGFLVLSAWCLGVLNSHRRFFLSYVAPVLWNAAQIVVLVVVGTTVLAADLADPDVRPAALASLAVALGWGTFAGGILQFALQLPTVLRLVPKLRPSLDTRLAGVRQTIRAFGPVVAARGVVQITTYVDLFLASFLVAGAVATLGFAQTLYLLPISLFGMSVAAAELPELSVNPQGIDRAALGRRLDEGAARIAFFVLPTIVAYLVIGDLVVGAIFQGGEFGPDATVAVWAILAGYTVGLLASTSSRLLQSALYGSGDAKTPAKVSALRVLVSAAVGAVLMLQLDRVGVGVEGFALLDDLPAFAPVPEDVRDQVQATPRLGALGLSLAAGAAAWLEYVLLRRAVRRRIGPARLGGGHLRRTAAAGGIAAVAGLAVRPLVDGFHPLLAGPLAAAVLGGVYLLAAARLGVPEISAILRGVRRRRR